MCINYTYTFSVLNYYLSLTWKMYQRYIKWVLNAPVNEMHPCSLKNPNFNTKYLKWFWLCQLVDCYSPDPSGQANFYSSHKITALVWLVCFSDGLSALDVTKKRLIFVLKDLLRFSGFTDKFFMKLLGWDDCFTETLASWWSIGHLYSCFVSLSNNYVIVKAFSKNISGSTNLAYSKKVNLQVPVRFSFLGLPLFQNPPTLLQEVALSILP